MTSTLAYSNNVRTSISRKGNAQLFFIPIPRSVQKDLPDGLWAFSSVHIKLEGETNYTLLTRNGTPKIRISRASQKTYIGLPISLARSKKLERGQKVDIVLAWD